MTFSVISLPKIKSLWLTEISLGSKGLSLLEMILEIILFVKLLRLIGFKSEKEAGLSILGISAKQV